MPASLPKLAPFCRLSGYFFRSSSAARDERACFTARASSPPLGGWIDLPRDGGPLSSVPLQPSVAAGLVACFGWRRALCYVLGVFLVRLFSSRTARVGDRDRLHLVHLRPRSLATVASTPWLTAFRSTVFGAALLGSGFVWNDIPPYFIGGLLGWLMLHAALRLVPAG